MRINAWTCQSLSRSSKNVDLYWTVHTEVTACSGTMYIDLSCPDVQEISISKHCFRPPLWLADVQTNQLLRDSGSFLSCPHSCPVHGWATEIMTHFYTSFLLSLHLAIPSHSHIECFSRSQPLYSWFNNIMSQICTAQFLKLDKKLQKLNCYILYFIYTSSSYCWKK